MQTDHRPCATAVPGTPALADLDLPPLDGLADLVQRRVSELPEFIRQTHANPDLAQLSMQMFYALQSLGQHDFALQMQARALVLRRQYRIRGTADPGLRLLAIMGPGNMMDNTPLEFITRHLDVRLDLLYLVPGRELPDVVADHDVAMVALGESRANAALLQQAADLLARWPRPVVNPPERIPNCARDRVSELLRDVPQIHVPATRLATRGAWQARPFPFTIRPVDSHAGRGLHRIDDDAQLQAYFEAFDAQQHYVGDYVDCRDPDGHYRKMRIALIDGRPYACHLAIASNWIVHYLPAGMEASADKRAEEAAWMAAFDQDFAVRHAVALRTIAQRLGLDYVVVDCAEGRDGRLLLFEADSRAWIHASEPAEVFPYKAGVMQKAFDAFRAMLQRRVPRP